ncbi:hypothetical protein OEZ86_006883 [Tetradesmus obliquus]|nr:hypothetical protein OEZ86_006883 [Tetradesmus obliquus]
MINTVKKRARAAANKQLEVNPTTGTTEADRSFNDLNSKSPKAKHRAAIAQKATFKGSAKSMPARLPAAAAADVTEAGSKVISKTAMRTIPKIVRTAGRALGPIGVLVEVAGIAFSLYEEITDILEYNNVCEKYETRYEEVKAMDPMTIRGALLEENQINNEAGSSDFMTFATFVQLVLGDGGSLAGRDWAACMLPPLA